MGENTRYIHIRHSKTFPRQSYSGIGVRHPPSRSTRRFPCSSFVPAYPLPVLPCRWGGKIAFMIRQPIVIAITSSIVQPISCRLPVPCLLPFSRSVHLVVRLIHSFTSSCVRSSSSRSRRPAVHLPLIACPRRLSSSSSSPRRATSKAGRCVAVSPYSVSLSPSRPYLLVRCRWMS